MEKEIKLIRKHLKYRLKGDKKTLIGQTNVSKHVEDLFLRTGVSGESNSALLIGPRGCGKTTVRVVLMIIVKDSC